jgi:hypothetical protein
MNGHLESERPMFVRALADERCELVEAWITDPKYDGKCRKRVTLTFLMPPALMMDMSRERREGQVLRVTTAPELPLDETDG